MQLESVILLVEGVLYRTENERKTLLGYSRHYDVRSAVERIEEAEESDENYEEFNEKTIAAMKWGFDKEFPSEVGQKIASIFTRVLNAETLAEAKKAAVSLF